MQTSETTAPAEIPVRAFATGLGLVAEFDAGRLSPVALAETAIARVEALNPRLNAFVRWSGDYALAEARSAEVRRAAGARLSPLDGLPIALKDLVEIEGTRTGLGSKALAERRSTTTATIVRRLRGAGIYTLGRVQMVEFATGGWGTNSHLGAPVNPWDMETHRVPGGSSSGSGVAVAAGLVPFAIGTDTGGSVRIPAAFCGVTGLKTTLGRISVHGVAPLAPSFDTVGPLARSAADATQLFEVLAGPDERDPVTLGAPHAEYRRPEAARLSWLRLGIARSSDLAEVVDPEVGAAFDAAVTTLEAAGASIVEREMPESFGAVQARCNALMTLEGYLTTQAWLDDESLFDRLDMNVRQRLLNGKRFTPAEAQALYADRVETQRRWLAAFDGVDAILTPTVPLPAIPVAEVDETSILCSRFTRAVNYMNGCALALPMGFSKGGLPLSLQVICPPFAESTALSVGLGFQARTDWHLRRPRL